MPIFEISSDSITEVRPTNFLDLGIKERPHLQKLLRKNIRAIAPDCLVLAEEFGDWADSKRRIDLLCLDSDANLVVVELKRTDDGGHSELQAIRYAAMIRPMTFDDAVEALRAYSQKSADEARKGILDFLGWADPQEDDFAQDVRIILVAADFSKEVTGTALWLNTKGIDIRCVRLNPYRISDFVFVDIQQIIPLPEATEYQNQLKKKEEVERQSRSAKKSNFLFSMVGIKPGTILQLVLDPNETCEVVDDRKVKFRNEIMSLTKSATIVWNEQKHTSAIAGTDYWMFHGKALSSLRNEVESTKMTDLVWNGQ